MGLQHLGKAAWFIPALLNWASTASAQTPVATTPPQTDAAASASAAPSPAQPASQTPSPAPTQANTQPPQTVAASPAAPAAPPAGNVVDGPVVRSQPLESDPDGISETTAPRELPYYEGEPAPQGYRLVERPRKGLVIAGALSLGIPYAISVSVAAGGQYNDTSGWLLIPVIGPWITAAKIRDDHCDDTTSSCGDAQGERGLAAFDGLAQAAGAAMLVVGLAVPKRLWVRYAATELSILPVRIGREGYGVVGVGRF
jgi:hypothetical protein